MLYAGRAPAAAPATGLAKIHAVEQRELIVAALTAKTAQDSPRETVRLEPAAAVAAKAVSAVGKSR